MRRALDVSNALYPATVADWFDSASSSQDTARDQQGRVSTFAAVFRVREAKGGGCWAQHGCRAHRQAGFGYRIRAWP